MSVSRDALAWYHATAPAPISRLDTCNDTYTYTDTEKAGGIQTSHSASIANVPLPAEKQRDLPTTPISVPIHSTPSPMFTQVEEERPEPAAEASNGVAVDADADESGRFSGQVDEGTDGSLVAEKAPPTPAKDGGVARSSQTTVNELASDGTSGSAT
jgi:hypothetical protein